MEEIEELFELAMLFDFYGELLKEHNKRIFEDYICNDLSLSEIAEAEGITRQGVHDIVKRCSRQLKEFEAQLHLVEKFRQTKDGVERIRELLEKSLESGELSYVKEASRVSLDVLSGL